MTSTQEIRFFGYMLFCTGTIIVPLTCHKTGFVIMAIGFATIFVGWVADHPRFKDPSE